MSTLSELIHYCNEDDPVGAMLLLGEWGCGKTYLIEKDLAGALKDTHIIIKVSLFGMNNQKDLQDSVRQKWFEACLPILGTLRKAKENTKGFWMALNGVIRIINPIAGGAGDVMTSVNALDLLPIKNEIEDIRTYAKKRVVLVYDDFENRKMGRFDARVSRYIASWRNVGGKFCADEFFKDWLKSEGLTEQEVNHV